MDGNTRVKLVNRLTEHDIKNSTKKGYNHYALGHYMNAVQRVDRLMTEYHWALRPALLVCFNGKLLVLCLKACDLSAYVRFEELVHKIPDDFDDE